MATLYIEQKSLLQSVISKLYFYKNFGFLIVRLDLFPPKCMNFTCCLLNDKICNYKVINWFYISTCANGVRCGTAQILISIPKYEQNHMRMISAVDGGSNVLAILLLLPCLFQIEARKIIGVEFVLTVRLLVKDWNRDLPVRVLNHFLSMTSSIRFCCQYSFLPV